MTLNEALPLVRDEYRRKIGMPQIDVDRKRYGFNAIIGYSEFRGNYMKEKRVFVAYGGDSGKDVVQELRAIQRGLDANG